MTGINAILKQRFVSTTAVATDRAFKQVLSDASIRRLLERSSAQMSLRVALVKQSSYADLYSLPTRKDGSGCRKGFDIYGSSNFRSGPVGLLANFDCDFIIVNCFDAPECSIWQYRLQAEAKDKFSWR